MRKNMHIQNKLTIIDQESIGKYLNELSSNKATVPLTPAAERELFEEYKRSGSRAAKDRLILANTRWVVTIAKQFSYPKARLEDLINEGNIGMMKAIDKFDPSRGTSFLTFATWDIRQAITTYINETLADVAQPANRYRINRLMGQASAALAADGFHYPTTEQMIEVYGTIKDGTDPILSAADYNEIRSQSAGFVSMESRLSGRDGEDMTLEATFRTTPDYDADHEVASGDARAEMESLLSKCLSPREKEIVEHSYGLGGRDEKTLEQVADILEPKLTRERVGQLLQASLVKLRAHRGKIGELCGTAAHELARA
jgi:RNA polymerase primary sigma factor